MDDRRPAALAAPEEADNVVGIAAVHHPAHEVVLPRDGNRIGTVGLPDGSIEILAQCRRDDFICIDHQHPRRTGLVNGELACRLHDAQVAFRKGDDLATVGACYVERPVCTLHVADDNLIEVFYRLDDCLQMPFGIVGVDDDRNTLCIVHSCKYNKIFIISTE